ncbi:hypothetical protein FCK90_03025 [Kocuria coralli]|uniref:DNA-3-methyladenine glycosylase I n=1 Tax=Kocuria coralli TaxID=1461025 RepID=A0A5J5L0A9_9MICC|nr:DNA-3-methyladenine glycosylase I [Kocuria coralli]KAA9395389.1 hypothetical protein FCK90_03025 [Kocuria coralli]
MDSTRFDVTTSIQPAALPVAPSAAPAGSPDLRGAGEDPGGRLHRILDHAVLCADGVYRCPWALVNSVVLEEHDLVWGRRPLTSPAWFEALAMEIFQAGLATGTAAGRRGALSEAMCGFLPARTGLLADEDVDELMLDRRLIRNRAKLVAVIHAARLVQGWDTEDWEEITGAAAAHPGEAPRQLAQRFRELGLVHVGPGIAGHFLARTGVVTGHVEGCHRHPAAGDPTAEGW